MVMLAVVVVLVLGASAAAYAALTKKPAPKSTIAAVKSPLATATSPTTPGTPATPGATSTPSTTAPGTPTTVKATPPKIPLQTPTPSSSESSGTSGANEEANNALFGGSGGKSTKTSSSSKATKTSSSSKTGNSSSKASTKETSTSENSEGTSNEGSGNESSSNSGSEPPSPILLDTNAASTYNPYSYPSTRFGDPSLAIDGEEKTAWTAQVDPTSAPKMAEGLVLDMKTAQSVGSVIVKSTTTGMTVTMYGANGHNLPASITDPAWKRLSGAKVLKKKSTKIKLKTKGTTYRFVLLWITKAPSGSTPSKPGSVSIDELELFPPN